MINKQSGFTLLFASLIVALLLSITFSIAHITLSQMILSSAGKESQFAFYNADSGIECALYYEYNVTENSKPIFPVSGNTPPSTSIMCGGIDATNVDTNTLGATTTTSFDINPSGSGCMGANLTKPSYSIKVNKSERDLYSTNVYIESRGYNTCDTNNPRRVERGLYTKLVD